MTKFQLLAATALVLAPGSAWAQTGGTTSSQNSAPTGGTGQETPSTATQGADQQEPATMPGDVVVTAQRQSQRLQDVPIAVSAFTADNIEKQQIVNPAALQQSLPSITYTKGNFTGSSFNIRGIGDLCVGSTCDAATAIHINDQPILGGRLFETEFFDLQRVEVLRGPQGTLFGRNATSGVVNFISAKPDLSAFHAAGEIEYGNYDNKRVKGMINIPLGGIIGLRVAGTYLKRDGYTTNTFTGNKIDDRDLYAIRGTLSIEPSSDTRLDLIGYYFREKDNRSRIQKQLCHRDPTGILGCLPDRLNYETPNGNSTLAAVLSSSQFFATQGGTGLSGFALQSLYGTDTYAGVVNPANVRTVRIDAEPTYFADEEIYQAKFFHSFGKVAFNLTAGYERNSVDSTTDYNLAVENPLTSNPGLLALNAFGRPGGPAAFLNGVRQTLIPNGPAGGVCQSAADPNNVGIYGGNSAGCFAQSLDFDRSRAEVRQYSAEAHFDSSFDGPFNFLLGGLYFDLLNNNTDYFVNAFGLDYASGILGAASSAAIPGVAGNAFLATPFYRNNGDEFRLKSYGIFGETYFSFTDKLKLTLGLRYNNDKKTVRARNLTLNILTPIGATSLAQGLNTASVDFDSSTPGNQLFAESQVSFSRMTGRAVLDYKITPNNLLYASYSRGYKSGGINPPLPPSFSVPLNFAPESIDAFEIGSKNTFGNGTLRLNLTGFYYNYTNLQLSRIVARTSVNDNVNAHIYGVEAEAIMSPTPAFVVNVNASYIRTKVSNDKALVNPRDVSGGRADAVIIKDITNGANCAVVPSGAGGAALSNGYVTGVNAAINAGIPAANIRPGAGLQGPTAIPGLGATGAYSICAVLQATATTNGVQVLDGVPVNIRGSQLPQAPRYKVSVGAQYTIDFAGGTIVPRADLSYTGDFYGSIFNTPINRVQGYEVVNAQIQFNARDDRFYVRGFVQNLTNNDAITGQYVTDQSSGLFTNIFTIDPRRYGVAAGFKF